MIKKAVFYWAPLAVWCLIIFYLSSIPNLKTEFGFWDLILRKIAHVTEFFILFFLAFRAISNNFPTLASRHIYIIAVLFGILYAVSDEYHQSFVPTRGPSVYDVGIDSIGVFAGFLLKRKCKYESRASN